MSQARRSLAFVGVGAASAERERWHRVNLLMVALALALVIAAAALTRPESPSVLIADRDSPYAATAPSAKIVPTPTSTAAPSSATKKRVADTYAKLPLSFVPNVGQTDERVRYYAQGQGFSFYFTDKKAMLAFQKGKHGQALELRFLGANPAARIEARRRAPGTVNYLTAAEHHTNLPTYERLVYRNLWPGIDMVFRGAGGTLKYEFHLRAGADPSDIRLAYAGAEGLTLGAGGALLVDTPLGALRDSRPQTYQRIDGRRVRVDSRYALADASYGFAVGRYERSQPLVIDPSLAYSTYLGGSSFDRGRGIAVDAFGSAYVTGFTTSANFSTTPGAYDISFNGGDNDAFITKLAPSGSSLLYSTYLGGSSGDVGFGIAVDGSGSAYLTGRTDSANFPTTPGAFDTSFNGLFDAFVTKLSSTGSSLLYSTYLGGSGGFDEGDGIAVDGSGSAYVTGQTISANFPTTPGAFDTSFNGGGTFDAFVTKLSSTGSSLLYSTYLGGSGTDFGQGVAIDTSGSAYVTGGAESADFPITPGAFDTSPNGEIDAFVTKLSSTGSSLLYSTYLGGSGSDLGIGVAVDASGAAYVTGFTTSANFPTTPGAFDTSFNSFNGGDPDAFVTKLSSTGSSLLYSTYLGGSGTDFGQGVAVDASGAAYVTGVTTSTDFPTTVGAFDASYNGGEDAFVTKLNTAGSAPAYSAYLGGSGDDEGHGIAVDSLGAAYVTGLTGSTNFPTTAGAFDASANGAVDAFVTKIAEAGGPATVTLAPKSATNSVDTQHCVTATVKDALGTPVPGVTVRFSVTGSVTASGSRTTNSSGRARFCYTGPALPGQDLIKAYADTNKNNTQDLGEPSETATKTWVLPSGTALCVVKITNGGWIIANNGDRASFGGVAKESSSLEASGNEQYQDHGPAEPINVRSRAVQALTCSNNRTQGTIFGTATINGSGVQNFRIDVQDLGEPGTGRDHYRIRLDTGYDSGDHILRGGNVQIH
jgi:hypothetical protein